MPTKQFPEDIVIEIRLIAAIDELDGCGLVVTDWDEIKAALKNNKSIVASLREVFNNPIPQLEH